MTNFKEFNLSNGGKIVIRINEISEIEQDRNHEGFTYILLRNGHMHHVVGSLKLIVRELEQTS